MEHAMKPSFASQRIVVTGPTGLIGSRLVAELERTGAAVIRGVRKPSNKPGEIYWNAEAGEIDSGKLDGVTAVVHLAGENIAGHRWTPEFKQRLVESRVKSARLFSETIAHAEAKPRTFLCASAIGYYGNRGDEELPETAAAGDDFLADLCRQWEAACEPARQAGVRVVNARLGVVLSPDGGALAKMATPFKLGLGGVMGHGRQYISWISIDDVVASLMFILANESLAGPVNVTAPMPVANWELTKTLAGVLHRPAILPMPAFAARVLFGEAADALFLSSTRVVPKALTDAGFKFEFPSLEPALRHLLGR